MTGTEATTERGPGTMLRRAASRRLRAWARRRTGVDVSPVTLGRRRVYIVPTGLGFTYAAMLFAMLLAGLNYGNNLALILTFVLTATGWVAMHECHRNLLGLRITTGAVQPPFAGQPAGFAYQLSDADGRSRYDLCLTAADAAGATVSVAALCAVAVTVQVPTHVRGKVGIERLKIESRFPLGFCRAWSWLHVEQDCVVYPQPSRASVPPAGAADSEGDGPSRPQRGDDDWNGLRTYQAGDPVRRIAWKAYARSGTLLVKELDRDAAVPLMFDWDAIEGAGTEERISRLTRLVVDAAARGDAYGLRLPDAALGLGRGSTHRHQCLALLATFRPPVRQPA